MPGPKMRLRWRKSFTIIPNPGGRRPILRWTVTKRGASLNLSFGPLSRSWGTRGNRTTIDAPGEMGLSWQKQHSGHEASGQNARLGDAVSAGLMLAVLTVQAAAFGIRMLTATGEECSTPAHALKTAAVILAVEAAAFLAVRAAVSSLRGMFAAFALLGAGAFAAWHVFGALVIDKIACS